jgi:uncharacterized protein
MGGNVSQAFLARHFVGFRRIVAHVHSALIATRRFFRRLGTAWANVDEIALLWAAAFLLLGFAEEFAYRGYSQATLTDGMGFWRAAVLFSVIFGAVHYFFKPMENWMDGRSVALFGLFWCFTLRRSGTLWFAIGFQAMSDYTDMVLFAQPNTGNDGQSLTGHLLNVSYHGPEWLTGGPRGTEASALEFLILALLFLAFARTYPSIETVVAILE